MKFEDLLTVFGHRDWFDLEMIHAASGEAAESVHTEVYRWRRTGKVIELRRGLFVLAEPWRKRPFSSADLAGAIYPPSYLSGRWALGYWGLLPQWLESDYSSVTARPARVFKNSFGTYSYATLPRDMLFGTIAFPEETFIAQARTLSLVAANTPALPAQQAELSRCNSLEQLLHCASLSRIALPEKALLDLCFMEGGDWDTDRLSGLGLALTFKNTEPSTLAFEPNVVTTSPGFDLEKFRAMAERSGRPRLKKAAKALLKLTANVSNPEKNKAGAVTPDLPWNEERP